MGFWATVIALLILGGLVYNLASLAAGVAQKLSGKVKMKKFKSPEDSNGPGRHRYDLNFNSVTAETDYMLTVETDDHQEALEEFDRELYGYPDQEPAEELPSQTSVKHDTLEMLLEYLYRRTYEGECEWEGKESGITTDVFVCLYEWKEDKYAQVTLTKRYNKHPRYKLRFRYPFSADTEKDEDFVLIEDATNKDEAGRLWSVVYEYSQSNTSVRDMLNIQQELKSRM